MIKHFFMQLSDEPHYVGSCLQLVGGCGKQRTIGPEGSNLATSYLAQFSGASGDLIQHRSRLSTDDFSVTRSLSYHATCFPASLRCTWMSGLFLGSETKSREEPHFFTYASAAVATDVVGCLAGLLAHRAARRPASPPTEKQAGRQAVRLAL